MEQTALPPYRRQFTPTGRFIRSAALLLFVGSVGAFYGLAVSVLPFSFYYYLLAPIGLGTLLVIWTLPASESYPDRTIEALFFAVVIATFTWPNYLAIALPGVPWITYTRALGLPLLILMLISLSISAKFRGRVLEPYLTSPLLLRAKLAFLTIQLVTLPMSDRIGVSLNFLLNSLFAWTALYFLAGAVFLKHGRGLVFVWLMCAIALALCLIALPEVRVAQVLWTGQVPALLQVPDEVVQRMMAGGRRSALGIYRVQSIFATSLNFAEFIGLCTPFFLYLLTSNKNVFVKLAIIIYIPFSFWVIRTTDSRLGVVALIASIMLYLLFWSLRAWKLNINSIAAPALVLSYPAVAAFCFSLTLVWNRLSVMVWGGGAQQASNAGRKQQYIDAIPKILANPFGNGMGESAITLGDTNRAGVITIDSYYLVLALDYGVLGFIAYAVLFFAAIWQAVRYSLISPSRDAELLVPAATLLAVFIIIKGVLAQDDNHSLVFVVLGMVAALAHRVKRAEKAGGATAPKQGGTPRAVRLAR